MPGRGSGTLRRLWPQARPRLLASLYGAIFGFTGGTLICGMIAIGLLGWTTPAMSKSSGVLPGAVAGFLIGLLRPSVRLRRRLLLGALIGMGAGAIEGAAFGFELYGPMTSWWYSPDTTW